MFLSRLYYERSCRCARMPGGIHLRLLGRYEHVAMCLASFGERRTEIMEGEYRPASCICNVSFPTCGVAKHSCYFLELCQGEVRHSRAPTGPGGVGARQPVAAYTKGPFPSGKLQ